TSRANAPPSPPSVRAINSRSLGADSLNCVKRKLATLPTRIWTSLARFRLQLTRSTRQVDAGKDQDPGDDGHGPNALSEKDCREDGRDHWLQIGIGGHERAVGMGQRPGIQQVRRDGRPGDYRGKSDPGSFR